MSFVEDLLEPHLKEIKKKNTVQKAGIIHRKQLKLEKDIIKKMKIFRKILILELDERERS